MIAGAGVLGADAIPGDPGALDGLVAELRNSVGLVEQIQAKLSSNDLAGSWTGQAADAFRASLAELPGELDKLRASFSAAADALNSYAATLAEVQRRAQWLATQIVDAENGLQDAQYRREGARSDLSAAQMARDSAADPVSASTARTAVDHASQALLVAQAAADEAEARLSSLKSSADANRREFDDAAIRCASALAAASELGIRSSFAAWFNGLLNDLHTLTGIAGGAAWLVEHGAPIVLKAMDFAWKRGIPALIGDVARWVARGGKGLSLSLIAQLRNLGLRDVQGSAKLLQALENADVVGGWGKVLSRFPGIANVVEDAGRWAGRLGPITEVASWGIAVVQFGFDHGQDVAAGAGELVHHPLQFAEIAWQHGGEIVQGSAFGIVHVLTGGVLADNPADVRKQFATMGLALNPQMPSNFNNQQQIAAQAALAYTGDGKNALPLVGGMFTSSSGAQRALYQGVLGNQMVAMVQNHDVAGLNSLVHWIQQQPYANSDVVRPYQMLAHALQSNPSMQNVCIGPQQAEGFIAKTLGRSEIQTVVQGSLP